MKTKKAYNKWAKTYDEVLNKTRDLEKKATRALLKEANYSSVIEIGCGTGKNSVWLSKKAHHLKAVDFSSDMMSIAKAKVKSNNVEFVLADITRPWNFGKATLITCSLILEHVKNLNFIFNEAFKSLEKNGWLYICELHPYKQIEGSRAKFINDGNQVELEYFAHSFTDFFSSAKKSGFICHQLKEWYDEDDTLKPRLASFIFVKK